MRYGLELGHVRANTMWCTSQVAEGVSELKNIALDMRDEVKMQSSMVDEITSKVRPHRSMGNTEGSRVPTILDPLIVWPSFRWIQPTCI